MAAVAEPDSVLLPGHDVPLGRYTTVRRLLPPATRIKARDRHGHTADR